MKKWLSLVISLFFLFMLALKLKQVGYEEMKQALSSVNPSYFISAVLLMVVSALLQAVRWQIILKPIGNFFLMAIFPSVAIGHWFNLILPARLGELARPFHFAKKHSLPYGTIIATTLLERVADALAILLLIFTAAIILKGNINAKTAMLLLFLASVTMLMTLAMIKYRYKILNLLTLRFGENSFKKHIGDFIIGINLVRGPKQISGIAVSTLFIWLANICAYGLLLWGCNLPSALTTAEAAVLVTLASAVAHAIPSSASGLGVFNYSVVVALEAYSSTIPQNHSDSSASIAIFSLIVYLAAITPDIFIGGYYYWRGRFLLG